MKAPNLTTISNVGSIAMSIIYGLKVNLSVAMVAMLNHTAIRESSNQTFVQTVAQITAGDDSCQESSSAGAVEVNILSRSYRIAMQTLKLLSDF